MHIRDNNSVKAFRIGAMVVQEFRISPDYLIHSYEVSSVFIFNNYRRIARHFCLAQTNTCMNPIHFRMTRGRYAETTHTTF